MNRYERGTRVPSIELVKRIADVLNLPIAYLYAIGDDEAKLLVALHRMSVAQISVLAEMAMRKSWYLYTSDLRK
ncbi:helix-turn-helix transcriptional regulator [Oxalobacteraceae bacterium OTU3REALA1]|nr:helix-turn-helix transcriptional regulator [Oxalobacteraceae bacterium OTU3REALA1]